MKQIPIVLSVLGLFLIFTLSAFTLPWADDFCLGYGINNVSALDFAISAYKGWDGRILAYFMLAALVKSSIPLQFTVFLWIICFLLSVRAVQKIAFKKEHHDNLFLFFVISIAFWLGMRKYISETVYWSSGGAYTFAAFVSIHWLLFYERLKLDKVWKAIGWAIFSVMAGIVSYSVSPALITFMFYPKLVEAYKTRKVWATFKDKKFIFSLFFVLVGTAFLVLAPGNSVRSTIPEDAFTGFPPWTLVLTMMKFIAFGWPLIAFALLIGILFKDKIKEVSLHEKFRWLLVAVATGSPFAVLNSFTSPRTSIFFHFFIFVFICYIMKGVKLSVSMKVQRAILGGIVVVFYGIILSDYSKVWPYYKEYSSQLALMEKSRGAGEDLVFEKTHREPRSLRMEGFHEDPKDWVNACATKYFDLKSLSVKNGR